MSDSSFEALLIDWLGIDSMQNTDDPAQFATLLDIIANVTMGELAKKAANQLLLHIHKDDDYADTLLFRRVDGQTEEDEDNYLIPMQTFFAKALYNCGESPEWLKDLFPDAEDFGSNFSHSPHPHTPWRYLRALLSNIADDTAEFNDRFFSWNTVITIAGQYTPQNCSPFDREEYVAKLSAAKARYAEQIGQAA